MPLACWFNYVLYHSGHLGHLRTLRQVFLMYVCVPTSAMKQNPMFPRVIKGSMLLKKTPTA